MFLFGIVAVIFLLISESITIPLSVKEVPSIPKYHELPSPYHKTDDILRFVVSLSESCSNQNNFKLEYHTPQQAMDLEMDTTPKSHGKSDEYFDFQTQQRKEPVTFIENGNDINTETLVQKSASAKPDIPNSWKDKSTPPKDLPVIRIQSGDNSQPKYQALIMFGEHGRELISSEIGMSFIQSLHEAVCTPKKSFASSSSSSLLEIEESDLTSTTPYSKEQIQSILKNWEITIIPIVSPSAREIAEKSNFCNRKNSNGIDVNRNYPFHFGEGHANEKSSDQYPGVTPLSEPESRIAAQIAQKIHPKLFVAVHSGAELIVTSPAYRKMSLEQMPKGVQKVVESLHREDCPNCSAGPASQVLSYLAYGCSMDYMFEEGFKGEDNPTKPSQEHFSFTFETWQGNLETAKINNFDFEKEFGQEKAELKKLEEKKFNDLRTKVGDDQFECLTRFNPPPSLYEKTRGRWTKALFSTLSSVATELKNPIK